jgi:hypothetical protein
LLASRVWGFAVKAFQLQRQLTGRLVLEARPVIAFGSYGSWS